MLLDRIRLASIMIGLLLVAACPATVAAERTETFDKEPAWEGRNNRAAEPTPRNVRQDFGYSRTSHAGGKPGEIGGFITPAAEGSYYGAKIPAATFEQKLSASGTLACSDQPSNLLVGFFNADTLNEWRTPNTIALRINGRGDVFYAYVEYCTERWHHGADEPRGFPTVRDPDTGRPTPQGFASKGTVHRWSLSYDPGPNEGRGAVTASIDDVVAICDLAPGHKQDGATFNRFGLMPVMKSVDGGGEIWLDDVAINGKADDFSNDPHWDAFQNRRSYVTQVVRPRFDFGFSATNFAGGRLPGELGGLVFRGDCRYPAHGPLCRPARTVDIGKPAQGRGQGLPAPRRQ